MRVQLRDLAPGQAYAIQFRSNDGYGNVSEYSQVQRFTTTNDLMPPADITGLTWADSKSSFVGAWNKVTKNYDNSELKDFRDYHCVISNGTKSVHVYPTTNHFEFTQEQNVSNFDTLQTTLTLTVTARDQTFNESKHPATLTATPSKPPTPSTPTLSNYLGLVRVDCNGNDNAGSTMPRNTTYYEIHSGSSNGFATSTATYRGRLTIIPGQQTSYLVTGLTYGTAAFIRVIAVNSLNKKSDPSDTATRTPARISGLDIENNQIAPEQLNWTSLGIPGANAYYKTSQPVLADAANGAFKVGDIWYDTGDHYTTYKWNGVKWVLDTSVGFIAGTKIIAGTITADAIATNLFSAYFAKINQAFIDNAYITYLDAGKITAGILQSKSTASYGGVTQPAWSFDINGNAVLNNAAVYGSLTLGKTGASSTNNASATVKSYNYAANSTGWAIKGDGSVEFNSGNFRGSITGATITTSTARLTGTADTTLSSTGHALQTGPTDGYNMAIDVNEIQARHNGAADTLNLNIAGGSVNIGNAATEWNAAQWTVDLFHRTRIYDAFDRDTLSVYGDYDNSRNASAIIHAIANEESNLSNWAFFHATSSNNNTPNRTFYLTGAGDGRADGSWTGGGADFAEYFESTDGTELPFGRAVTLDDGKVRLARPGDEIVGVTSAAPTVVGNEPLNWPSKYQKDVYGAYLLNEKGGRILNEAYDADQEYTLRSARPEWNAIGLLGQIIVDDDGTCVPGGTAVVGTDAGTFTAGASGYKVINRIDTTHVRVLVHP